MKVELFRPNKDYLGSSYFGEKMDHDETSMINEV